MHSNDPQVLFKISDLQALRKICDTQALLNERYLISDFMFFVFFGSFTSKFNIKYNAKKDNFIIECVANIAFKYFFAQELFITQN